MYSDREIEITAIHETSQNKLIADRLDQIFYLSKHHLSKITI
jgi:hypothetical protein